MCKLINFTTNISLENYTLLIPSVSVGNIPQLTIDLIITTYNLKKAATLWHYGIIPSVGGNPFINSSNEICTACELYVNEDLKLAAIQLRSKIDKVYANEFFKLLAAEISNLRISNVFILTSTFASEMRDVQSSKFRYISTNDLQILNENNVIRMELINDEYMINGAGFATKLYDNLHKKLTTTVLIKYAYEGDNRPDAIQTLELLQKLMNLNPENLNKIIFPSSWEYVYGNPPPKGIY